MSEGYLGEIRIFSYDTIPPDWMPCNGQILKIRQNQALFSLIGSTYGGDERSTFALPNPQGRVPIEAGGGFALGAAGREFTHALTTADAPAHRHVVSASTSLAKKMPPGVGVTLAQSDGGPLYSQQGTEVSMNAGALSSDGGGQPHENMMPYIVLTFCISVQTGTFPSER